LWPRGIDGGNPTAADKEVNARHATKEKLIVPKDMTVAQ